MDKFIIEGGKKLKGEVIVSGAKNAALPILTGCILTGEPCLISNVPKLRDIDTVEKLLSGLGAQVEFKNSSISVKASQLASNEAPYDLVKTMRASVLLLGPLLARSGKARVSLPGGCAIGERPINLHLAGLKKLGAEIKLEEGYIEASARRLIGNKIHFDIPTVTGTMNLMMAASLAKGQSLLENCAMEPEVVEVGNFLNKMGAKIEGHGSKEIKIQGVESLGGVDFTVIPDRIEVGTLLVAAGITGSSITVKNAYLEHIEAIVQKLNEAGVKIEAAPQGLKVSRNGKLYGVDMQTQPFPGFPTDMQAQFVALMSLAEGSSVITENIFESRFMHVAELKRMGADIRIEGSSCVVKGVKSLKGAPVMATDLRASASLVLAALAAKGSTEIRRIYHLDRGYEHLEKKLNALGASVRRLKDSSKF